MAPEVWRGLPYGYSSDLWSLGCVLYNMMTFRWVGGVCTHLQAQNSGDTHLPVQHAKTDTHDQPRIHHSKHCDTPLPIVARGGPMQTCRLPFDGRSLSDLKAKVVAGRFAPIPPGSYSQELTSICHTLLTRDARGRPTCAAILASPEAAKWMHAVPEAVRGATLPSGDAALLPTIRVPHDLRLLEQALPKAHYGSGATLRMPPRSSVAAAGGGMPDGLAVISEAPALRPRVPVVAGMPPPAAPLGVQQPRLAGAAALLAPAARVMPPRSSAIYGMPQPAPAACAPTPRLQPAATPSSAAARPRSAGGIATPAAARAAPHAGGILGGGARAAPAGHGLAAKPPSAKPPSRGGVGAAAPAAGGLLPSPSPRGAGMARGVKVDPAALPAAGGRLGARPAAGAIPARRAF